MKILFILDKYYPKPLANSICSQNLIDEFVNCGDKVDVITYKDSGINVESPNKSVRVFLVNPDIRVSLNYYSKNFPGTKLATLTKNIATLLNRTKKIILFKFFPLYSLSFPLRIYFKIKKLNKENGYDIVISTYGSFENALGTYLYKKKFKNIKWVLYTVDSFINDRHKFINKKGNTNNFWLPKFLDNCDMFIYMKSRENEYRNDYFDKWKKKMFVSDIPLLKNTDCNFVFNEYNNVSENWVYAGSLGLPHYKTDDLINIFLKLNDGKERFLNFYSSGKELNKITELGKINNGRIKGYNYVTHNELLKIYSKANILVSIKYSNQISAKIFEYMTYNKKIVHISGSDSDPDEPYLKLYKNCCILKPYKDTLDASIKKLEKFLKKDVEDNINLLDVFEMNQPKYTCNLIKSNLD